MPLLGFFLEPIQYQMRFILFEIVILIVAILFLIFTEVISFKYDIHKLLNKGPFIFRFVYYYILACFILMMGVFAGGGQFIYFQF